MNLSICLEKSLSSIKRKADGNEYIVCYSGAVCLYQTSWEAVGGYCRKTDDCPGLSAGVKGQAVDWSNSGCR